MLQSDCKNLKREKKNARNLATGNGSNSSSCKSEICIKIFCQITTPSKLLYFWRAILQPETEELAASKNQKSASKFSVKSQHHLITMILFDFWSIILQPQAEVIAACANQNSASKFSVKSQRFVLFPGSNFYLPLVRQQAAILTLPRPRPSGLSVAPPCPPPYGSVFN